MARMKGDAVIAGMVIRLSSPVRYKNGRKASINKTRLFGCHFVPTVNASQESEAMTGERISEIFFNRSTRENNVYRSSNTNCSNKRLQEVWKRNAS